MLSADQLNFLLAYNGFQPNINAEPRAEFTRLAAQRYWKLNSKTYLKAYMRFGSLVTANTPLPNHVNNDIKQANSHVAAVNPKVEPAEEKLTRDDDAKLSSPIDELGINDGGEGKADDSATCDDSVKLARLLGHLNIKGAPQRRADEPRFESIRTDFKASMNEMGLTRKSRRYGEVAAVFFTRATLEILGTMTVNEQVLRGICHDLGISPIPISNNQMKKAINNFYVNIYDFLDYRRSNRLIFLKKFTKYHEFKKYTQKNRLFPLEWAKKNDVLKLLLEPVF